MSVLKPIRHPLSIRHGLRPAEPGEAAVQASDVYTALVVPDATDNDAESILRHLFNLPHLSAEQVRDIIAAFLQGSGRISVTHDDDANTLTIAASAVPWAEITGKPTVFNLEQIRDAMAAFLQGSGRISVTHDDDANTLTIAASAVPWSEITGKPAVYSLEQIRDAVAAFLQGSGRISITHDDDANTLTIAASAVPWSEITGKPTVYSEENIRDIIGTVVRGTGRISVAHNDPLNTVTVSVYAPSWNEVTDRPTIPAAQVPADWNAESGVAVILNKPTVPAAQVPADWNATTGVTRVINKPIIPAAQMNADWNAGSGVTAILNKPFIPAAQVSADWNATTGIAQILNKPAIPTDTNDYADAVTLSLSGSTLTVRVGRTGDLADLTGTQDLASLNTDTNTYLESAQFTLSTANILTLTLGRSGTLADLTPQIDLSSLVATTPSSGDGNDYVNALTLSLSGTMLTARVGRTGSLGDLTGTQDLAGIVPAVPSKATSTLVDVETDDSAYMTVAQTFRAIARKVKNATETVTGLVRLVTNADIDASTGGETDNDTRVVTIKKWRRLFARILPQPSAANNNKLIKITTTGYESADIPVDRWRGDWTANVQYESGDFVEYDNRVWICTRLTSGTVAPPSATSEWDPVNGMRGTWVSNTAYFQGEIVKYRSGVGEPSFLYIADSNLTADFGNPHASNGRGWIRIGGANSNDYVNSLTVGVTGQNLGITLGRTGNLSDLTASTPLPTPTSIPWANVTGRPTVPVAPTLLGERTQTIPHLTHTMVGRADPNDPNAVDAPILIPGSGRIIITVVNRDIAGEVRVPALALRHSDEDHVRGRIWARISTQSLFFWCERVTSADDSFEWQLYVRQEVSDAFGTTVIRVEHIADQSFPTIPY